MERKRNTGRWNDDEKWMPSCDWELAPGDHLRSTSKKSLEMWGVRFDFGWTRTSTCSKAVWVNCYVASDRGHQQTHARLDVIRVTCSVYKARLYAMRWDVWGRSGRLGMTLGWGWDETLVKSRLNDETATVWKIKTWTDEGDDDILTEWVGE